MELELIQNKIYEIRGYRVMLDFDLAETYGIETKVLKQAVRRNFARFEGDDFMFELTNNEYNDLKMSLRSQFVTSNEYSQRGGTRYAPFAFTELGVAMLSSVLNSETAIDTNRKIMRAFVAIRQLIVNPPINEVKELQNEVLQLKQYIEEVFTDYNDINESTQQQIDVLNQSLTVSNIQFSEIYLALAELAEKKKLDEKPRRPIGFHASRDY